MKYQVVRYGTPVLREPSRPVTEFDRELAQLSRDMLECMYDARGIGLAAQQIGKTLAICVIDLPSRMDVDDEEQRLNPEVEMPLVLINPEVTSFSDQTDVYEEGCLSFPGINGKVSRPVAVTVTFQDPEGNSHTLEPIGLLARVIQHEIDHLNGVLFIERMSATKRFALKGKLRRMKAETEAEAAGVVTSPEPGGETSSSA